MRSLLYATLSEDPSEAAQKIGDINHIFFALFGKRSSHTHIIYQLHTSHTVHLHHTISMPNAFASRTQPVCLSILRSIHFPLRFSHASVTRS